MFLILPLFLWATFGVVFLRAAFCFLRFGFFGVVLLRFSLLIFSLGLLFSQCVSSVVEGSIFVYYFILKSMKREANFMHEKEMNLIP